eukprot:2601155-Rhodomonas_salina.1
MSAPYSALFSRTRVYRTRYTRVPDGVAHACGARPRHGTWYLNSSVCDATQLSTGNRRARGHGGVGFRTWNRACELIVGEEKMLQP